MTLLLYMDVHVRDEITQEVRRRDVDVLTAQQDGTTGLDDPALLDRATTDINVPDTFDDAEWAALPAYLLRLKVYATAENARQQVEKAASRNARDVLSARITCYLRHSHASGTP